MRKRSKYKPKGVRLDAVTWVINGFKSINETGDAALHLKIKNHSSLDSLRTGTATKDDIDNIIAALNVTEALSRINIGEDYAKEIAAKHRVLVYLIDRDNEKDGVQAWPMPSGLDRDIVKVSVDKASGEVLQIDHPEDGYDLTFEKNGTGIKTKYEGVAIARRSSPLGKASFLDFAMDNPLPDQLQFYDYDHIAKVFSGKGAHKEKSRDDDRGSRGGRDRDERPSPRDRDRDDDRGSRNEPQGRRREIDPDDVPDRGRDAGRGGRDRSTTDTPTWDSVHGMTGQELEDLIDQEGLKINPNDAKSDDELADWICEDLKIEKTETRRRASTRDDPPDDDRPSDRLRRMRQSRD